MHLILIVIVGAFCIMASFGFEGSSRAFFVILGISMIIISTVIFYKDLSHNAISDKTLNLESSKPTHFGGIPIEEIKRKYGK